MFSAINIEHQNLSSSSFQAENPFICAYLPAVVELCTSIFMNTKAYVVAFKVRTMAANTTMAGIARVLFTGMRVSILRGSVSKYLSAQKPQVVKALIMGLYLSWFEWTEQASIVWRNVFVWGVFKKKCIFIFCVDEFRKACCQTNSEELAWCVGSAQKGFDCSKASSFCH